MLLKVSITDLNVRCSGNLLVAFSSNKSSACVSSSYASYFTYNHRRLSFTNFMTTVESLPCGELPCLIKESKLPEKAGGLLKVDLSQNQGDIPQMSPSGKVCYEKLSKHSQDSTKKGFKEMFKTAAEYLQHKLHLMSSKLVLVWHNSAVGSTCRTEETDEGPSSVIESA